MTRLIFLVSLISLGNAIETGECVLGSEASCGGQDSSVLLQGRTRVIVEGACSANSDVNCCFTQAGVDTATANGVTGTKVGACAAGAKAVAGDKWATLIKGLATCKDDACSSNAIPTSGTCAGYTCPQGMSQRTNYLATATCTNAATCEFNCCQTDVNADPVRRNGILTYVALWTVVNATRISNQVGFPRGQAKSAHDGPIGNEYLSDMQDLHDHSEGLRTVMNEVDATMAAEYCPGQSAEGDFTHLTHIKGCVDQSMCVMAANEKTEEDVKTITMLREYYGKFEDITWDHLWTELNVAKMDSEGGGDKASPFSNKDIDFMSAAELACQGVTRFVDELDGSASLTQMDIQAAAYEISEVLVDAAKTTHALLDSVRTNSSMDVTLAALHRAWEQPCKMLDCDNTNYWDLLGASHSHSVALIEAGASAHHMHVHVRTRGRLEVRMQRFLASEEGRKYASKIYRVEGSTSEARMNRYVSFLKDSLHQVMTNHPKKYGLDYTLLSLYARKDMKRFFKTPVQSRLLEAYWDRNLYLVADEKDLDQLAEIQALRDQEELSVEDEERLEKIMKKTLFFKAIGGFFQDVGKGVVSVAETVGTAVVDTAEAVGGAVVTAANAVADVATDVANGALEVGKAIGEGVVTGVTAIGEAVITVVTAVGDAIVAFVDFIVSLLECLGFGSSSAVGYGKKFPCPTFFGPCPAPTSPCPQPPCPTTVGVALTLAATLGSAIADLVKGIVVNNVGISLGVVIGFIPGGATTGGLKLGVGIAAGVYCTGGSCLAEIAVGAVASATLPIPFSPRCVLGKSVFGFGCAEGYGITMKLLCCSINLTDGCQSCGSGGCDSAGGESAPSGAVKAEIDKAIGATSGSCDESLSGDGADYRGCQTRSTSGKECQKWSSQYPHKHGKIGSGKGLGDHNMCRNPDGHSTIWCYTKDPNKRWENCGIFKAVELWGKLEDGGGGGFRRRMKQCQGDCDNNGDCGAFLACQQRENGEFIPGCHGDGPADYDYCTSQWLSNGGGDGYRRRMKACQGDCDNNGDCSTGRCFQRDHSSEHVPNCGHGGSGDFPDHDYCAL